MILLENPVQSNPPVKFAGNIHRKSGNFIFKPFFIYLADGPCYQPGDVKFLHFNQA
jgi:hypothetical protein